MLCLLCPRRQAQRLKEQASALSQEVAQMKHQAGQGYLSSGGGGGGGGLHGFAGLGGGGGGGLAGRGNQPARLTPHAATPRQIMGVSRQACSALLPAHCIQPSPALQFSLNMLPLHAPPPACLPADAAAAVQHRQRRAQPLFRHRDEPRPPQVGAWAAVAAHASLLQRATKLDARLLNA